MDDDLAIGHSQTLRDAVGAAVGLGLLQGHGAGQHGFRQPGIIARQHLAVLADDQIGAAVADPADRRRTVAHQRRDDRRLRRVLVRIGMRDLHIDDRGLRGRDGAPHRGRRRLRFVGGLQDVVKRGQGRGGRAAGAV